MKLRWIVLLVSVIGIGICMIAILYTAAVVVLFLALRSPSEEGLLVSPTPTALAIPGSRSDFLNLPFARGAPPSTFDPALASDTSSSEVIVEVFSGLVTIDRNLKVQPDIAESWTLSEDRKTYIFRLRSDAKFQNGKTITAQDFKYSIERAADPAIRSPVARSRLGDIVGVQEKLDGRSKEVSGVQVVDDRTLRLTIDAPKSYFLAQLATQAAFVVDRENVEQSGTNWFLRPNGSGPYKLIRYAIGDRIVLERNDLYYGAPKPSVKTITFWFNFSGSFVRQYLQNELDSALVHAQETNGVFAPDSPVRREVTIAPTFRIEYVGLNNKLPPFDDVKVRQAFNLAIDKKGIAEGILRRTALPAKGIIPPGFPAFNPDLKGWEYDPLKARQLIKESKYGDVRSLPRITLTVSGPSLVTEAVVPMIRQNLGIDLQINQQDFGLMIKELERRPMPFEMYSLGRVPELGDPAYLDPLFHSQGASNYMGYSNLETDKLLEQARSEPDEKKRFTLYQEAEQVIVNDAPWIPLFFNDNYWLTKPYVKDLIYPPMVIPRLKYVSVGP